MVSDAMVLFRSWQEMSQEWANVGYLVFYFIWVFSIHLGNVFLVCILIYVNIVIIAE